MQKAGNKTFDHTLYLALWIIILALASVLFQGHQFGTGNTIEYLSWIWWYNSSGEFLSHDFYLSTSMLHANIVVPLSYISRFIPVDVAFLLSHIVTRILLCAGVFMMAYAMFGRAVIGYLALIAVVLFPRISLGGHYAHAAHFEANFLGFSLAVLMLAFLIMSEKNKTYFLYAGIALGILFNAHLFIGLHMFAVLVLLIPFMSHHKRAILTAVVISLLVGAPTLLSTAVQYMTQERIISGSAVAEILAFRHPHHHSPFTWHPLMTAEFACYTLFWLVLSVLYPSQGKIVERIIFAYITIMCLIHVIFVEIFPVGFIAYLQSFRQTVLFTIFISIYLGRFAVDFIDRSGYRGAIPGILLIAMYRIPRIFIPLAVLSLVFYLLFVRKIPSKSVSLPTVPASFQKSMVYISLAAMLLLVCAGRGVLNPPIAALTGRDEHFRRSIAPDESAYQDICTWIEENTSATTIFIIPPNMEGFRVYAERSCVVDFKAVPFTNAALARWFDRISRVGNVLQAADFHISEPGDEANGHHYLELLHKIRFAAPVKVLLDRGYRMLSEGDVVSLSHRFGAHYFLTFSDLRPYDFSKLYENDRYVLYSVN